MQIFRLSPWNPKHIEMFTGDGLALFYGSKCHGKRFRNCQACGAISQTQVTHVWRIHDAYHGWVT